MNWKTRTIIAASLGLSCSMGASTLLRNGPGSTTAGTGTVGPNGLKPRVFWGCLTQLTAHMNAPLIPDGGTTLDPAFWDILEPTSGGAGGPDSGSTCAPESGEGVTLVQHAMGCALSSGQTLTYTYQSGGATLTLTPDGILSNNSGATGWLDSGLNPHERQDIYTCLAARMNPAGPDTVWMNGADTNHHVHTNNFPIIEAGWQAIVDDAGVVTITVWPIMMTDTGQTVGGDLPKVYERVCAKDAAACAIQLNDGGCTWETPYTLLNTCAGAGDAGTLFLTRLTCAEYCAPGTVDAGSPCACNPPSPKR